MDAKELLKKIKESAVSEASYGWDDIDDVEETDGETFEVPVKIVFEGTVTAKGETYSDAADTVLQNFGCILGDCGDNLSDDIVDWNIDIHGTTFLNEEE